jgi:protein TonB
MTAALSPRTSSGSFLWSLGAHLLAAGAVVLVMNYTAGRAQPEEEYIDLAYQTFDEPPVPAAEEKRVMKSPEPVAPVKTEALPDTAKELQDEKGEVAGTQAAAPETNIGSDNNGNATSTPYYKIKPKYPKAALLEGVEGWVMMEIDITETGEVENIRVVDGEQRNTFQSEAKRAVAQWKYKPFVGPDGKPFRKADHHVRVDFKLDEAETSTN